MEMEILTQYFCYVSQNSILATKFEQFYNLFQNKMKVLLLVLLLASINTSVIPSPPDVRKSTLTVQKFIEPSPGCFKVYLKIGKTFDFPSNFKRQNFMKINFTGAGPKSFGCRLLDDDQMVSCNLNNLSNQKFAANFSYSAGKYSDSLVLKIDPQNMSALKTSLSDSSEVLPQVFGLVKRIRGISPKNFVLTFVTLQPFESSANYSLKMKLTKGPFLPIFHEHEITAFATNKQKLAYRIDVYFPNSIPKYTLEAQFLYGPLKQFKNIFQAIKLNQLKKIQESIDPSSIIFAK